VAEIPQTEDVGFDAVATILRNDGTLLIAENSFCVQFKARSVREIPYDRAAYDWLRALELPLLIGSVDAATQELALFTTHNAVCRVDADHYDNVTLRLDSPSRAKDRALHEWLGDPILCWTHRDMQSDDFRRNAYRVLAAWIRAEQLHHPLRLIKTMQLVKWNTNEPPVGAGTMLTGHADDLQRDVDAAAPYLMKLGTHFLTLKSATPEAIAFLLLAHWLESQGVEHFKFVAQALASQLISHGEALELNLQHKKEP